MTASGLAAVAAELVLGLRGPETLPSAAVAALGAGLESRSLNRLAGLTNSDEARTLLDRALDELDIPVPSPREAVMLLARNAAIDIVRGTTAPYHGAKRIWELAAHVPIEAVPELQPFVYAADEWEERPEDRRFFDREIVREARALAESASAGPGDVA